MLGTATTPSTSGRASGSPVTGVDGLRSGLLASSVGWTVCGAIYPYTSQLMSGHENFKAYLRRLSLRSDATCQCGFPNGTFGAFSAGMSDGEPEERKTQIRNASGWC
ncbi:unnamed protein product [Macrosiphum euphorbiae]|uniref:Uncharacterized protein n=1 Tax=Macrosiphum euphorbiae TaxID=13131 RepID=A0AAV0WG12_9HEMI|nr:unnamed protein product [Macrosiphum euphorbiae]